MIATKKCEPEDDGREVAIDVDPVALEGTLALPKSALGLVLFAHGSGSSRHSPRNRYVAHILQTQRIATLVFDLLTHREESVERFSGEFRFNIPFLVKRLVGATRWVKSSIGIQDLQVGYFGASTGAGASLMAPAELPEIVFAVVSRGGRPDLAGSALRPCSRSNSSDRWRKRRAGHQNESRGTRSARVPLTRSSSLFQAPVTYLRSPAHWKKRQKSLQCGSGLNSRLERMYWPMLLRARTNRPNRSA